MEGALDMCQRLMPCLFGALLGLCVIGSTTEAEASSTHYLFQLQAGVAASSLDTMGPAFGYGLAVGYGGRLRGTPVRFYAVAAYDRATFSVSGSPPQSGALYLTQRSHNDIQLGLRVLLPVARRLRWYAELLAGGSHQSSRIGRGEGPSAESADWAGLLSAVTGLEVRWHRNLATGLRAEARWTLPDEATSSSQATRLNVMLSQSVLF